MISLYLPQFVFRWSMVILSDLVVSRLVICGIQYFVQRNNNKNVTMVTHFSLLSSRLYCCFLSSPSILRCTVFLSIFLSVACSHFVCVCECDVCVLVHVCVCVCECDV